MTQKGIRRSQQHKPGGVSILSVPELDASSFRKLVDQMGGRDRACAVLGASRELVDKWYSGELHAPQSAVLACYWHGPAGFSQAFTECHWTHEYNAFLKNEARARVDLLERFIVASGLAVPPGRITTVPETLLAGPDDAQFVDSGEGRSQGLRQQLEDRAVAAIAASPGMRPAGVPALPSPGLVPSINKWETKGHRERSARLSAFCQTMGTRLRG